MTTATPKPRAGEQRPYGNDYGDHRRIVACMCACEGIHTDALMPGQLKLQFDRIGHLAGIVSERDLLRERERELVKALRQLLTDCDADLKPMGLHPARTLLRAFYPDGR